VSESGYEKIRMVEALALLVIAIVAIAVAVFGGLGEVTRW
jgi:hypothetical protein